MTKTKKNGKRICFKHDCCWELGWLLDERKRKMVGSRWLPSGNIDSYIGPFLTEEKEGRRRKRR